jgi:hypothetical protein
VWNDVAEETQRELASDDGQLLQESFLIGGQAVDASSQHALDRGGNMQLGGDFLQPVLAAVAAEHPLLR